MPPIEQPKRDERPERLALNVFDLDRASKNLIVKVLGGKITKEVVTVDSKREDEIGLLFSCSLETAALCSDILQSEYRREGLEPIRVYLFKRGGWVKLPFNAVLTVNHKGQIVLNPDWFPKFVATKDSEPIAPKRFVP